MSALVIKSTFFAVFPPPSGSFIRADASTPEAEEADGIRSKALGRISHLEFAFPRFIMISGLPAPAPARLFVSGFPELTQNADSQLNKQVSL
jgi:hypothetical protein